ncbi:DegV family protein with EDD domain [Ureibacillus xyleni]|uniref:DegV family protein with EDD domain n=1 Tax=Ureibacillus xyleni TaxID=614648 RepID=A0A285RAT7_9BACL|nr:DegV family protein [Ureibacillus xyleni]SOB90994.1 DegV family protein with EDD domain [Ureibacillus xyleni]
MRIAIVTDSTAYLTPEERARYNIHMIPLSVNLEDGSYEEEVEITSSEFYDKVRNQKQFPKTTQPAVGKFVELFNELSKDYDDVISIHLSSGISGTFQGAVQAGQMVDGITVYTFDSEISCAPQGLYAIKAAEMSKQGASVEQIMSTLEEMKSTMDAYFVVDDLTHLQRGGRLSSAAALVGGLLQVKPILTFDNKAIVPFEKIRTKKKALRRVEELLAKSAQEHERLQATVIHANCEEEGREWMKQLAESYPNVEFSLSYFGPVIGTHLGEASLGLGWVKKI